MEHEPMCLCDMNEMCISQQNQFTKALLTHDMDKFHMGIAVK